MIRGEAGYLALRIEGGLLSRDLVARVAAGDRALPGNRPEDYDLAAGERLGEAASRCWEYLLGAYRTFRERLAELPGTDAGTTLTRDRWIGLLFRELGFGRLTYQRGGLTVGESSYPVSHRWEHVPIHIVGWHVPLDRGAPGHGPTRRAPQSMLQELLNTSDAHLWGLLTNGRTLRLLRDSTALAGSAYLEFDLEAMFDSEAYAEFVLLYALLHVSRFAPLDRDGGLPTPADCWLERWRSHAVETGIRARNRLREGVRGALGQLGTGFLEANPRLRTELVGGAVSKDDFHHELLRLAYQLIFLFVAEDRGALLDPEAGSGAHHRYTAYFSTARLRRIAARRRGDRHGDLWQAQVAVLDGLGADGGLPELGLPALGGLFFRAGQTNGAGGRRPDLLRDCVLVNDRLLAAVRLLAETRDERGRTYQVDYQHLDAEELGSVYESLLELVPHPDVAGCRFWLEPRPGNERKETGSYYTPTPLIDTLLDTALEPVIDEYAAGGDPERLLRLTVCDPACGSGHFLVAAARRIARRYAAMHNGEEEPSPHHIQEAMGAVIRHCLYGVDVNPLAVELARISLWLESLEPGKPLAFLDAHVKVGNSLLGTTPRLLFDLDGVPAVPDQAFRALGADDDRKLVARLQRENRKERAQGVETLFSAANVMGDSNADLATRVSRIAESPITSLADVREQARRYRELEGSPEKRHKAMLADAWCAAFVWPKHPDQPPPITTQTVRRLSEGGSLDPDAAALLTELTGRYGFFHWHLEFPEIFPTDHEDAPDANPDTGWRGGFACVLGNPPWERVKLQEKEFFATRDEQIATAATAAARKRLIQALATSDEPADQRHYNEFQAELRKSAGWLHLLRESGSHPLTGRGDLNTYAVFAETARALTAPGGRCGLVLPTGIVTDATTAPFFRDLVARRAVASIFDFENEEKVFPAVTNRYRFALLTIGGRAVACPEIRLAFRARQVADLSAKIHRLTPEEILLVNPNTGTSPTCDYPHDAEILTGIYRRVPVLWRDDPESNPWGLTFQRMFDMATDSRRFQTHGKAGAEGWQLAGNVLVREKDRMLPLFEPKLVHQFDHRFATFANATQAQRNKGTLPRIPASEKADPHSAVLPRYWVDEADMADRLAERWDRNWLVGWRDICRSSDERTVIATPIPLTAVGHKYLLAFTNSPVSLLVANLSAFVLDYCARQKYVGASFGYFPMKQLPVLPPDWYAGPAAWEAAVTLADWVTVRVVELTYTAWDMAAFARDHGDDGPPFEWDEQRRSALRAELDAAYFHLYGVAREDVAYIMDSFRAFRNNQPGWFAKTRDQILAIYDVMAEATSRTPYRTILDPPPGHGRRHPPEPRPR